MSLSLSETSEAEKMFASFRDLYYLKLKEKPDPRNEEVLETMKTVLSAIPSESRTLPIVYHNQYLGDVGVIALCETIKSKHIRLIHLSCSLFPYLITYIDLIL